MPGPPWESQLRCTLFLARVNKLRNTNRVILPHEWNHGISLSWLQLWHRGVKTRTQVFTSLRMRETESLLCMSCIQSQAANVPAQTADGSLSL